MTVAGKGCGGTIDEWWNMSQCLEVREAVVAEVSLTLYCDECGLRGLRLLPNNGRSVVESLSHGARSRTKEMPSGDVDLDFLDARVKVKVLL